MTCALTIGITVSGGPNKKDAAFWNLLSKSALSPLYIVQACISIVNGGGKGKELERNKSQKDLVIATEGFDPSTSGL